MKAAGAVTGSYGIVVALMVMSLTARGPIIALAPVVDVVGTELGFDSVVAGLLTGLPLLCFAVATPLATAVIRRSGPRNAIMTTLVGVCAATVVRAVGDLPGLIAGTVALGFFLTIGNIAAPMMIQRGVPSQRRDFVTGMYAAGMNVGAMLASATIAPLAGAAGWRIAILSSAAVAVVGVVFWHRVRDPQPRRSPAASSAAAAAAPAPPGPTLPQPPLWKGHGPALLFAFAGQCLAYYGLSSWIPSIIRDGVGVSMSTGAVGASIFQFLAIVGALAVPIAARRLSLRLLFGTSSAVWVLMPIGMLAAPQWWIVLCSLGGIAQGAGVTLVMISIIRLSTPSEVGRISALVFGGGYGLGAASAPIMGGLHEASGTWTAALIFAAAAVVLLGASGAWSVRHRGAEEAPQVAGLSETAAI